MIDLVLAGDNAVVIGLAAAGLPKEQRGKAILVGILAATILRILFALVATQLLAIIGLLFAGGVLLLWVCWKMWRELATPHQTSRRSDRRPGSRRRRPIAGHPIATKDARAGRHRRSSSPTSRCRSTTCSPSPAPHTTTRDSDFWPRALGRPDGCCRDLHRTPAPQASLDRLCRPGDHPLRITAHDVGWRLQVYDCNPTWFGQTEIGPHCPITASVPAAVTPH